MEPKFYAEAVIMTSAAAPHTEPRARPTRWELVKNVTVLKVQHGSYRNSVLEGAFLIDQEASVKYGPVTGKTAIAIVYCLWFDTRLKTRGIELEYQVDGSELLENFQGQVVTNISLDGV
jgi:hypothetical protein